MTRRPHILFVDDEPMIIEGLGRMLRPCRKRWEMSFAEGGAAALDVLRSRPCDVVVSDFRMPGIDGAALLEHVRAEYPGTSRIILSGQTDEHNLLKIMMLAHEMLTKPATPEQLIATIERLLAVPAADDGEERVPVAFGESLPSPPHTLIELVSALDADDASAASIGTIVERDPAITAKVLHLVNSSAYTAGRNVSDVGQAIALLGPPTLRGLVLLHDLIRVFDAGGTLPAAWIDTLTRHAIESSRLARLLGDGTEWQSHAFTAGLLHEVGQLVMASARPAEFRDALAAWKEGDSTLQEQEKRMFDVSHVQVGARLLGRWGLPDAVVEAVAGHAAPLPSGAVTSAAEAVALAHAVVEAEDGPVCGALAGATMELDATVRDAVSRWHRDRAH
ncbi:HDOD domain-containing protein [Catenuloplanes japonicus]|uniref:HDOD domain-containing protein n=1 Tax=Catenuloplanes japonicus TaxID=33876 RepID=UPI000691FEC5|nr:HDOD domain-containing protein [Catenuloplanes japonicus]